MPGNGIRVSALLFGLLAGGCGDTAEPPPTPAWASLTEASGLRATDEIDGLDLAVDDRGGLHLVWRERLGVYGGPRGVERIVYRQADGTPLRWAAPIVVAAAAGTGMPQVVVTPDGVHVLAGARLRHWWLPTGGDAFVDHGDWLPDGGPGVAGFDAIASGDGIAVVFVPTASSRDQKLHGVHRRAAGPAAPAAPVTPITIAELPRASGGAHLPPRLHSDNGRLVAVWAETVATPLFDEQTRVTTLNRRGRVRAVASDDGGRTWGTATDVAATTPSPTIRAVAATGTADAPVAFFSAYGLFASRRQPGAWTAPARIAGYSRGSLAGSEESTALAATQCAGHTTVAWVDARHRRSDRRWWSPLGGFPWGDNPDWFNNDLFVATRADLPADPAATAAPVRLTPAESFTREVAIAPRDGGLVVIRAGRARVRKSPEDAGAPPVVLQSQVPCD